MTLIEILAALDPIGYSAVGLLISLIVQSTLLIAVGFIAAHLLRRSTASVRHMVWVVTLCTLLIVPLISMISVEIDTMSPNMGVLPVYTPPSPKTENFMKQTLSENKVTMHQTAVSVASPTDFKWALMLLVYCAGVVFFLSTVVVSRFRLRRWGTRGFPVADGDVKRIFSRARDHLGIWRNVDVIESSHITAPLTIGTFRPVVLIPKGMTTTMNETEIESLAIHELSHVRRFDSLIFSSVAVLRAVLFINPLVWYAARQVGEIAENACDDEVVDRVGDPITYAEMLTRLAVTMPKRIYTTELAAGFILSKHTFLRRVENILIERRGFIRLSMARIAGVGALVLVALIILALMPFSYSGLPGSERNKRRSFQKYLRENVNTEQNPVTISGTVVDPQGNPVAGAAVTPVITGTSDRIRLPLPYGSFDFQTDGQGRFYLKSPADGIFRYNLVAHDGIFKRDPNIEHGLILEWRNWANGVTDRLDTQPGGTIENVTIILTKPCTVSGIVRDADGNPMTNHGVNAHPTDLKSCNEFDPSVKTDEQGRYTLRYIRPGETTISSTPLLPPDIKHSPKGHTITVKLAPGKSLENVDLVGMPYEDLKPYLNKHAVSLRWKIRRAFMNAL
ncbi:M56 family metallopeptidase [Candidatus Latescibacterota bacterium]